MWHHNASILCCWCFPQSFRTECSSSVSCMMTSLYRQPMLTDLICCFPPLYNMLPVSLYLLCVLAGPVLCTSIEAPCPASPPTRHGTQWSPSSSPFVCNPQLNIVSPGSSWRKFLVHVLRKSSLTQWVLVLLRGESRCGQLRVGLLQLVT